MSARIALVLIVLLTGAGVAAQDQRAVEARLATGQAPDAVARQLIRDGADAEDVAALLFRLRSANDAVRVVAFAAVHEGARLKPADATLIAVGVAGLAQPAGFPAAVGAILAVPASAAETGAAVAQTAPQAGPLIAAAIARLVPDQAIAAAAAIGRVVPRQALFVASAVLQILPQHHDAVVAAVERSSGVSMELVRQRHEPTESVGANAMRESDEVLAILPLKEAR